MRLISADGGSVPPSTRQSANIWRSASSGSRAASVTLGGESINRRRGEESSPTTPGGFGCERGGTGGLSASRAGGGFGCERGATRGFSASRAGGGFGCWRGATGGLSAARAGGGFGCERGAAGGGWCG